MTRGRHTFSNLLTVPAASPETRESACFRLSPRSLRCGPVERDAGGAATFYVVLPNDTCDAAQAERVPANLRRAGVVEKTHRRPIAAVRQASQNLSPIGVAVVSPEAGNLPPSWRWTIVQPGAEA